MLTTNDQKDRRRYLLAPSVGTPGLRSFPVGLMVEKTLGPRHWHDRLPFYAREVSNSAVEVRGHSQAVMDQEIASASAAGLDYWAFVIYPPDNPLSLGFKLYLNSPVKSKIHFCLNLQGGWMGDPVSWSGHIALYVEYFKRFHVPAGCGPAAGLPLHGRLPF